MSFLVTKMIVDVQKLSNEEMKIIEYFERLLLLDLLSNNKIKM